MSNGISNKKDNKMKTIIIAFVVLLAAVFVSAQIEEQEPEKYSVYSIAVNKKEASKIKDTLSDSSLLYKDICSLTDEDWEELKPGIVQYTVNTHVASKETGTFNLTALDNNLNPERRDYVLASLCDEGCNMEKDMDSKFLAIAKGYDLRIAKCGTLPGKEESCNRCDGKEEVEAKKKSHGSNKNHSK